MTEKKCTECGLPILVGDKTASGEKGEMHYACFKHGTAHGREVESHELPVPLQLHQLRKWCRELQKRIELLEDDAGDPVKHNIRIGGSR